MIYLLLFLFATLLILLLPERKYSLVFTGILIFLLTAVSSWIATQSLVYNAPGAIFLISVLPENIAALLVCDRLSAFFILVINFTVITGFLYSTGYLKPGLNKKPELWIKLHYLALVWLQASMIMVPLFRNGFWFLVAWEMMTISSFLLVIYDFDSRGTIRAGLSYLLQMHIGMLFILAAFMISSEGSLSVSFENLGEYFSENPNWPVWLLFFIGFGLKAGFLILHTWLPDAHPAAPSHISGIMSGVMIKLGIYGILRVTTYLSADLGAIGGTLIIISAVTGLFGVMMAILQHDIKKLLAYHSIENIGIIGLGIGLGIYGASTGNSVMSAAGYAGALLHTLNHSIFKSLLFYSSGSVIYRLHTQNIEKMGGLMRSMPLTAWAFLIGSVAITGLPPLNGFISEFLIYTSIFNGIAGSDFYSLIIIFVAMLSLVLIGGLALLCFTKVFGIVFLGQPRSDFQEEPAEAGRIMLVAKMLPVLVILIIGTLPFLIIRPLMVFTYSVFSISGTIPHDTFFKPMVYISAGALVLFALIFLVIMIRRYSVSRRIISMGPTWGCGYTAVNSRQQYTASSFIQEYSSLSKPIIKTGYSNISYNDEDLFPEKRDFHTSSEDRIRSGMINRPADYIVRLLRRAAVFQTGRLQHYVLYALIFLLLIFLLTFLKII